MSWDAPSVAQVAAGLTVAQLDEHAMSRAALGRHALAHARRWPAGGDQYRRWIAAAQRHGDAAAGYRRVASDRRRRDQAGPAATSA